MQPKAATPKKSKVEFFKSKSDAPAPEPKVKAKPKAATPKQLIQFEFIWNDGFCENPPNRSHRKGWKMEL